MAVSNTDAMNPLECLSTFPSAEYFRLLSYSVFNHCPLKKSWAFLSNVRVAFSIHVCVTRYACQEKLFKQTEQILSQADIEELGVRVASFGSPIIAFSSSLSIWNYGTHSMICCKPDVLNVMHLLVTSLHLRHMLHALHLLHDIVLYSSHMLMRAY